MRYSEILAALLGLIIREQKGGDMETTWYVEEGDSGLRVASGSTLAGEASHSGGQPIGYKGQKYEVSVFDEEANGRRVVGWTNDPGKASQMATGAELRPGWTTSWVTDLFTDISHTQHGKWVGERPLPANGEVKAAPLRGVEP